MRLTTKCHLKALSNTVELSLAASVTALVADVCWLAHDVITNGMSVTYAAVGTGLVIGLSVTVYAMIRHHKDSVKGDLQGRYREFKVKAAIKAKAKAKREKS